jgi:hypothetical protein
MSVYSRAVCDGRHKFGEWRSERSQPPQHLGRGNDTESVLRAMHAQMSWILGREYGQTWGKARIIYDFKREPGTPFPPRRTRI